MKKAILLSTLIIFITALGFNQASAAPPASDVDCTNPCIDSYEIEDGAVTRADVEPIANVVVVALSGGDFISIQEAIDSITPSSSNPYVIDVMPGTYVENVVMKSYMHLRGAGREVTTIESPSASSGYYVIIINTLTDVAISGLTIKGGYFGITISSSSPTITANTITGNAFYGIFNSSSSPMVSDNIFTGNNGPAIRSFDSSPTITANTFKGGNYGVYDDNASSTITGNFFHELYNAAIQSRGDSSSMIAGTTITGNFGYGIRADTNATPVIIHNRITDNDVFGYLDIYVDSTSIPNISFNVYDTITGTTGVGKYNVDSNGNDAPAP